MPLFHMVPRQMLGNILMPLNLLRGIDLARYEIAASKYQGRESTMKRQIPFLNCLWNDIINLCPVHPSLIREQRIKAGYEWWQKEWFEIDPQIARLNESNSIIWLMKANTYSSETGELLDPSHFTTFSYDKLCEYAELKAEAIEAYEKSKEWDTGKLLFNCVPHIFFKGTIDVTLHKVITVE